MPKTKVKEVKNVMIPETWVKSAKADGLYIDPTGRFNLIDRAIFFKGSKKSKGKGKK